MKTRTNHLRLTLAIAALLGLGLAACSRSRSMGSDSTMDMHHAYHCAMHPQIVSDQPGDCPICHMHLIPFDEPSNAPMASAEKKILFYRNPMDPSVTSPVAMKDGMGMDYIPVYKEMVSGSSTVSGQAAVAMTADVQQMIGVTVSTVSLQSLTRMIRASAKVAYDPGLYGAMLERRQAMDFLTSAQAHGSPELQEQARATVRSSELRLRQMGISGGAMDDHSASDPESSSLLVGSSNGPLWVYASIFDDDAAFIRRGQHVRLTTPAMPGDVFNGTVSSIDPVLDSETRTLRVRIRAQDPQNHLKPEMFLSAEISVPQGTHLAVPASAVLDTGTRQLVYVQTGPGHFEPHEVHLGTQMDHYVEVLDGLHAGDTVATAANFLIDSESRINAVTEKALQKQ